MRPDFKHTATGWVWLDKLTLPFWWVYDKWAEWRFFRFLGKGDAEKGRELLKRAVSLGECDAGFCTRPAIQVLVGKAGDFHLCAIHQTRFK